MRMKLSGWKAIRSIKRWTVVLAYVMCIILLLTGVPVLAEPMASPSPKAEKEKDNSVTEEKKVSGKIVKKPPFVITVDGTIDEDLSEALWNVKGATHLNLVGKREEEGVAGDWKFFVTYTYEFKGNTKQIKGLMGGLDAGFEISMKGTATGKLVDLVAKKKKEEKENRAKGIYPSPPPKQAPVRADPQTIRNSQEAPIDAYSAEFDVDCKGSARNINGDTVGGTLAPEEDPSQWVSASFNFIPESSENQKASIKLNMDSNNNVVVDITASGKTAGPFVGTFTSEEELQVKRKDSYKWPIWGVWTDVNLYEPMPNLQKDAATVADQIKNKEEVKKVSYPNGRWVSLKLGKKEDPSIYKTLQVSDKDITFETGEIWPYPGSAMFVPTELTVYSKDLKEIISTEVPSEYEQVITYSTVTDTIVYPDFGRLVRVRDANLLGVWSSAGALSMPDVEKDRAISPGTWYEFTRGAAEDSEKVQKGYSAPYKFLRLTVNSDRSMVMDKGTAVIMPIAEEEMVILSGISTQTISAEGKKSKKTDSEDETILVSDFSKAAGTVKLSLREYTLIPGLPLKGDWSTETPPLGPPDVESGAFAMKNSAGEVKEPTENANWISFNKEMKTFEWTQMLGIPDGILVRKGNYRTIGEDLLLLTDILGSFYARPGSKEESFKDQPYQYGEKLFQINQTKKDDKPDSLSIGGVGSFKPEEK